MVLSGNGADIHGADANKMKRTLLTLLFNRFFPIHNLWSNATRNENLGK